MKVVIAGGRDYTFTEADIALLDALHAEYGFTEVFSGGAPGADACGEAWASSHGLPVTLFEADWRKFGRRAGPLRNEQMAKACGAVVLFPGGPGTASMRRLASQYERPILND